MKTTAFYLLAALGDLDVLRPTVGGSSPSTAGRAMTDVALLVGALLAVSLLLLLVITVWIKSRRHRHHHHHHRSRSQTETAGDSSREEDDREAEGDSHSRRRRKRRREHRPLNPTLAETGGLPPVREGPPSAL